MIVSPAGAEPARGQAHGDQKSADDCSSTESESMDETDSGAHTGLKERTKLRGKPDRTKPRHAKKQAGEAPKEEETAGTVAKPKEVPTRKARLLTDTSDEDILSTPDTVPNSQEGEPPQASTPKKSSGDEAAKSPEKKN